MTDLEKAINTAENTEGTTTSEVGNDFNLDFSDSLSQEAPQVEPNLSENSSPSEIISSPDMNEDISSPNLTEDAPSPNLSEENSLSNTAEDIPSAPSENTSPNLTEDIPSPNLSENISSPDLSENIQSNNVTDNETSVPNISTENAQPDLTNYQQETNNNEVSLGKFDDEPINTTNTEEANNVPINSVDTPLEQPSLLEQPSINENPLAENPLAENPTNTDSQEQEKNKLSPKEKLAQLVKAHESKAQKSGFIKGILSGIALTIVIVLAGFFFAKDQILDLINKIDGSNQQLTANVIDITNTTDEEITPENEIINEDTNDEDIAIEDEENYFEDEVENEEFIDEDIYYEDDIVIDEDFIDTEDYLYDEENEDTEIEDSENSYTITHVDSEKDANWVLPSHCYNLTCYGEDKEFTPCTTFRQSENLDENANRIGKNGVCKYKDSSELVFVEFK